MNYKFCNNILRLHEYSYNIWMCKWPDDKQQEKQNWEAEFKFQQRLTACPQKRYDCSYLGKINLVLVGNQSRGTTESKSVKKATKLF